MPSPEVPLQHDLFTGTLVDNRTQRQKQADRNRELPRQAELFSAREVAQFGIRPRPLIPLAPGTKLGLVAEDHRTPEEIEADVQQQAEQLTYPMFANSPVEKPRISTATVETTTGPDGITRHYIHLGDEIIAMTLGATHWNEEEVEAQLRHAHMIASALNARPLDAQSAENGVDTEPGTGIG